LETVKATVSWSPRTGVLSLYSEPPARQWVADPFEGTGLAALLWELDEQERETGRLAGVDIVGFLDFKDWDAVPRLPFLWQLPGRTPLPLHELLHRLQAELGHRARPSAQTAV
jgi:hypothetical protein